MTPAIAKAVVCLYSLGWICSLQADPIDPSNPIDWDALAPKHDGQAGYVRTCDYAWDGHHNMHGCGTFKTLEECAELGSSRRRASATLRT